jgi:hypothetical protein
MSYHNHDGHSATLTEPNGPALSEATPSTSKKTKIQTIEKSENDEIDQLMGLMAFDEEIKENATDTAEAGEDSGVTSAVAPIPVIPITNKVYGRYRAQLGSFELELRVDLDGVSPLQKISGDYYQVNGQTKSYYGSFIVDSITKTIANGVITVSGIANTSWVTSYKKIKLAIKQTNLLQPLAPALMQWFHATTNAPGALYVCNHFNRSFRTVRLEQDCTSGVTPFVSYNTGLLPSGGPARVLSINTAYQEAGVEMINAGISNVVPIVNITSPANKWSDAELHASMVNNFSLYQNLPQWAVWLLHAYEHELGAGLYGIMFDQQGLQRQGCAVFYRGIGGVTAEQKRLQLYTTVHELGHCFNLLHSWQKSYASPPKPNIPGSLSWMNYPWYFPGGPAAFWNAFPFRFDPVEVAHIRHGFRNDVIMGGNPFTVGSSLDRDNGAAFEDNVENHSSLYLELETKPTYVLGEPICLETKLKTNSMKSTQVVNCLHADMGFVTIGIRKPGGEIVVYEPVAEKCVEPSFTVLNGQNPSIYESSYIGFSKDGIVFDQVGNYQLKAIYYHTDGSQIISNTISLRVKNPVTAKDDEVTELLMQEDVGLLMTFKGSDASYLSKGNDALQLLTEKYKDHPMAAYAQYVRGVNAQRTFKTITSEKLITVREPNYKQGEALLTEAIEKSKGAKGLDNISMNQAMQTLAKAYHRQGNKKAAEATVKDIVNYFTKLPIKEHVKEKIRRQSSTLLAKDI